MDLFQDRREKVGVAPSELRRTDSLAEHLEVHHGIRGDGPHSVLKATHLDAHADPFHVMPVPHEH